jgi:archaellin
MTQIYLEDQLLDISKDFSQQITYAIDDLLNLDSKSTSFTKTIILPGTNRNNQIFGNIFEFSNSNFTNDAEPNVFYNFNASKSAKARLEINGLQAMKGVLRLLSIVIDGNNVEYEVALFGELGGFVSKLGNKKLTDLDFSNYNHDYTISNITESWNFDAVYSVSSATFTARTRFNAKVVCSGILAKLKAGDRIYINDSDSNNGNFIIYYITFDRVANTTTIVIELGDFVGGADTDITISSVSYTIGSGYVYPLINYGNVTYNIPSTNPSTAIRYKDWQFKAFRPALFVREYMDKIVTDAGYTWESAFFNTNFFRSLIIPNNDSRFFNKSATSFVTNGSATAISFSVANRGQDFRTQQFGGLTLNYFTQSAGIFTYTGAEIINVKIVVKFYYTHNFTFGSGKAAILRNNQVIKEMPLIKTITNTFALLEINTQLNPNDNIRFNIFLFSAPTGNASASVTTDTLITIEPDPPSFIPYEYDDNIKINDTIPQNIFQKDFFTSIMKMFNLMVTEDKFKERHLKIEPNVNYYQLSNYEDWTEKINRAKPITIKPMSEINARYYKFNFKQDSDYYADEYRKKYSESYGNRVYDNNLEFAKNDTSLEVIFSSSILTGYPGEDKVFPAIYKLNNDVEESINHNIRIMQLKYLNGVTSYKILNGTSTLDTRTDYLYCGHLDSPDAPTIDLNFGATKQLYFALVQGSLQNNLFNLFYSSYMAEITDKDSRLLTAEIKLTEKDIFNLDFSRFKMIDGVLYKMMRVIDWSANELCKAEFLRVINTTYQPNFYIGMEYGGGKIFYIDSTGQHGLIAPLESDLDSSNLYIMDSASPTTINAYGTAIGTGKNNTENIYSIYSASDGAAYYATFFNAQGYTDWYIPSKDEFQELLNNESIIYSAGFFYNFGTRPGWIWTSSQVDNLGFYAYEQGFPSQFNAPVSVSVIPIRSF